MILCENDYPIKYLSLKQLYLIGNLNLLTVSNDIFRMNLFNFLIGTIYLYIPNNEQFLC